MEKAPRITIPPQGVQVWLDFDNTITTQDVLDLLIAGYAADESWKSAEAEWGSGEIGSLECLSRQFSCIRITPSALSTYLTTIGTDPGLRPLLAVLHQAREGNLAEFAILSDGIGMFIRTILGKADVLADLTIRSNEIEHVEDRLELKCPLQDSACTSAAAHCKCASARALAKPGRPWIYVGDGRSDLCPSRLCDVVFAKGALARYLTEEGRSFIPFNTLEDVAAVLGPAFERARGGSR